jgi:Pentapeptide repeats (9 copies)
LKIDDPKKLAWKEHLFDLRGRHLEHAVLNGADLTKADLTGAQLQGASLDEARLQRASFDFAQLQGASLKKAQLQRASLSHAQLQRASLAEAQLQGASLDRAQLQVASLSDAWLQGVSLFEHQGRHRRYRHRPVRKSEVQSVRAVDDDESQRHGRGPVDLPGDHRSASREDMGGIESAARSYFLLHASVGIAQIGA